MPVPFGRSVEKRSKDPGSKMERMGWAVGGLKGTGLGSDCTGLGWDDSATP
ncbi:hypothetical protein T12_16767 [Trichinella patagoniensis]|uniref:Uncharacterized protein n=1 Tax=Trichinella patagoniensis TaxID=990121 RepID=A0A0V1AC72_9BILA|nr:hypothetical protein T12_16767 [Trichinella patagoniensis]